MLIGFELGAPVAYMQSEAALIFAWSYSTGMIHRQHLLLGALRTGLM